MKKISQREARRLQSQLLNLQDQERIRLSRWGHEYPGGVHLLTFNMSDVDAAKMATAQLLQHALVVRMSGSQAYVYAI